MRKRSAGRRVADAARDAKQAWRRAGAVERVGLVTVAAGAATVAGAALMALAHASATLALLALPLLLAPALLALAAAFGTVLLAAGAGAAGGLLLLAPALAVGAAVRLAAEFAIFAALGGALFALAGRVLGRKDEKENKYKPHYDDRDRERKQKEKETSWSEEMFRSFDRALHEREARNNASGKGAGGVNGTQWTRAHGQMHRWSVDDVIDELVAAGLGQFAPLFDNERVDGAALIAMREDDLRAELTGRVPLGARVKLWRWIEDMQAKYARDKRR